MEISSDARDSSPKRARVVELTATVKMFFAATIKAPRKKLKMPEMGKQERPPSPSLMDSGSLPEVHDITTIALPSSIKMAIEREETIEAVLGLIVAQVKTPVSPPLIIEAQSAPISAPVGATSSLKVTRVSPALEIREKAKVELLNDSNDDDMDNKDEVPQEQYDMSQGDEVRLIQGRLRRSVVIETSEYEIKVQELDECSAEVDIETTLQAAFTQIRDHVASSDLEEKDVIELASLISSTSLSLDLPTIDQVLGEALGKVYVVITDVAEEIRGHLLSLV
ncbi:hypothetical protein ACFE04_001751 [Oxalis oulophora]